MILFFFFLLCGWLFTSSFCAFFTAKWIEEMNRVTMRETSRSFPPEQSVPEAVL